MTRTRAIWAALGWFATPDASRVRDDPRLPAWHWTEVTIVAANLASVFFISRYLFAMNDRGLFYGFDGEFVAGVIGQYAEFAGAVTGLPGDLIRGLGNIGFALDPEWFPSYLLSITGSGTVIDYPLCYAVAATELFAGIALCAWIAGFRLIIALAAAWAFFFATWQIAGHPAIENFWRFYPQEGELLAVGCLVSAALLQLGRRGVLPSLVMTAAIFGAIVLIAVTEPADLVLFVPCLLYT